MNNELTFTVLFFLSTGRARLNPPSVDPEGKRLKLFTTSEVAKALRRSNDSIRREVARKNIAYHRLGYRIFISEQDLDDYLARRRVAANAEGDQAKTLRKEVAKA